MFPEPSLPYTSLTFAAFTGTALRWHRYGVENVALMRCQRMEKSRSSTGNPTGCLQLIEPAILFREWNPAADLQTPWFGKYALRPISLPDRCLPQPKEEYDRDPERWKAASGHAAWQPQNCSAQSEVYQSAVTKSSLYSMSVREYK